MQVLIFIRNIFEAGIRYIPSFAWLFSLPFDQSLLMPQLVQHLSVVSIGLTLSNIGFDRALLAIEQKSSSGTKNIFKLQILRTTSVIVFIAGYWVYLRTNNHIITPFEFQVACILGIAQSLEAGDWYLRALGKEKLLLQTKAILVVLATPIMFMLIYFDLWIEFHVFYIHLVVLTGLIPFLYYKTKALNPNYQALSFRYFLITSIRIGKDFYFTGLINITVRRISPALLIIYGGNHDFAWVFYSAIRILDASTPIFVAATNYLYRRWANLQGLALVKSYLKLQTALAIGLTTLNAIIYITTLIYASEVTHEVIIILSMTSTVAILNQRNPLFLAMKMTNILPIFNFNTIILMITLLLLDIFSSYILSGVYTYLIFLLITLFLTHLYLLKHWRTIK